MLPNQKAELTFWHDPLDDKTLFNTTSFFFSKPQNLASKNVFESFQILLFSPFSLHGLNA